MSRDQAQGAPVQEALPELRQGQRPKTQLEGQKKFWHKFFSRLMVNFIRSFSYKIVLKNIQNCVNSSINTKNAYMFFVLI